MMPELEIRNCVTSGQWATARLASDAMPVSEHDDALWATCVHDIQHPVAVTAARSVPTNPFLHGCCGCCQVPDAD